MPILDVPYKEISKIKGLEDFTDYYIDINGNIYSTKKKKLKKLSPGWAKDRDNPYLRIILTNKNKKQKVFYIHQLVRNAFFPDEVDKKRLTHKGSRQDNSVDNFGYRILGKKKPVGEIEYELKEEIKNEIKLIHRACIEKGLHTSDSFTFINEVVNEMLEEYVNRKGLKKILYRLKNEGN